MSSALSPLGPSSYANIPHPKAMSAYQEPYGYARPPSSTHGETASPDRSSYVKVTPGPTATPGQGPPQSPYSAPQNPSYPLQPPITPISGSQYAAQPPSSGSASYIGGVGQNSSSDPAMPSPPPTGDSRPGSATAGYGPDGAQLVPVGISGGKMFRCRGYGDCDKVFTRSEHLARHVRKHTGERPFPCHCGKAFSRLDNLRQHAATVHADQAPLNEAMLNSLAPVHAALSQRANRDQRKRGEVVEVPKNAVERPRHNEGVRIKTSPGATQMSNTSPYGPYGPESQWGMPPQQGGARPRTGGGYDYPYQPMEGHALAPPPGGLGDEMGGPSRRPTSSGYPGYPLMYYDQPIRPPTAPAQQSEMSQLPYPYRPMSSNGRELPVPAHYAESETPTSAHSHAPPTPMYSHPAGPHLPQDNWTSPPHSGYPPSEQYHHQPGTEGYGYAASAEGMTHPYGPPPHPQAAYYPPPPGAYYPPQQYGQVPPPQPQGAYPPPGYGGPHHMHPPMPPPGGQQPHPYHHPSQNAPPESPFSYHAPIPAHTQEYAYGQTGPYDSRKRRAEDDDPMARKAIRSVSGGSMPASHQPSSAPMSTGIGGSTGSGGDQEIPWLPPTTERRSSLAISALLGSPQQIPRSRPTTADIQPSYDSSATYGFPGSNQNNSGTGASGSSTGGEGEGAGAPRTPMVNGTPRTVKQEIKQEGSVPTVNVSMTSGGLGQTV